MTRIAVDGTETCIGFVQRISGGTGNVGAIHKHIKM